MASSAGGGPPPQTLRQAKAAYRKLTASRACRLSDQELRQIQRRAELDARAAKIKEKERKRMLNRRKREEKEKKRREEVMTLTVTDREKGKGKGERGGLDMFFRMGSERTMALVGEEQGDGRGKENDVPPPLLSLRQGGVGDGKGNMSTGCGAAAGREGMSPRPSPSASKENTPPRPTSSARKTETIPSRRSTLSTRTDEAPPRQSSHGGSKETTSPHCSFSATRKSNLSSRVPGTTPMKENNAFTGHASYAAGKENILPRQCPAAGKENISSRCSAGMEKRNTSPRPSRPMAWKQPIPPPHLSPATGNQSNICPPLPSYSAMKPSTFRLAKPTPLSRSVKSASPCPVSKLPASPVARTTTTTSTTSLFDIFLDANVDDLDLPSNSQIEREISSAPSPTLSSSSRSNLLRPPAPAQAPPVPPPPAPPTKTIPTTTTPALLSSSSSSSSSSSHTLDNQNLIPPLSTQDLELTAQDLEEISGPFFAVGRG